jgi:hypothetical protein
MFSIGTSPLPGIAAVIRQHEPVIQIFFPSFSVEIAMQAAPRMAEKLLQPFFNRLFAKALYPYRIQMDITGQDGKVGFLFHQNTLISSLIKMTCTSAAAVKITSVGYIEMAHEFAQITERSFHQKMEMIVHQDVGIELDGIDSERQGQKAEKLCSVLIVPEDALPFVAAARYVIHGAWVLDA